MNVKIVVAIIVIALLTVALILMKVPQANHSTTQIHADSSNTSSSTKPRSNVSATELSSSGREAIFIDRKDPEKRLSVPGYAILKIKDKIYALGGVAVIFSEDLRPLCYMKLKYNIQKAENYDEDRFVAMKQWYSQPGSIAMFDSELNLIWSIEGNFTDFRVANGKIYAIESRSGPYYLNIFDKNGNLIRSFKALDVKEIAGRTVVQFLLSIEVSDGKIYIPYVSGEAEGPYKLMLLRFDEKGNLELKKEIYETKENMDRTYIYSYKDGLLLAVEGPICRYIYVR